MAQISNKLYPIHSSLNANLKHSQTPLIQLESIDLAKIQAEDAIEDIKNEKAPRFGIIIPTDIGFKKGVWNTLPNGDRIWRVHIKPKNAKATNLYFDDFHIPNGATLHIYSPDKDQILGGFGAHNNSTTHTFTTALIYGDDLVLEYYEPIAVKNQGRLHISGVNHAYRMVSNPKSTLAFGDSGSCEVNVNCSPEGDGKSEQKNASVKILTTDGASTSWCSGTVVNNSSFNCKPYILTAIHCIGNSNYLQEWVFYFNYQSSGCTNPTEPEIPLQTMTGAIPLVTENGADVALLELNNTIPQEYNAYYAGWDISDNDVLGGYGIHHPKGDIKKISIVNGAASVTTSYVYLPSAWEVQWKATTNGHGVTEGGSSGSGLFNSSGHVIGTLQGGWTYCGNTSDKDYYGNISYQWEDISTTGLKSWLDPEGKNISVLDGAYSPCSAINTELAVIEVPGNYFCNNTIHPRVKIVNKSITPLTSLIINYQVDSEEVRTFNWEGVLNYNQAELVTLPEITVPTENPLSFHVFTEKPNGQTDVIPRNDSLTVVSAYKESMELPYYESFQGTSMPSNITIYSESETHNWSYNSSANAFQDSNEGSCMFIDNYNFDTRENKYYLQIPSLDFSKSEDVSLSFDVAYAQYDSTWSDGLEIRVSVDCGLTYTTIFSEMGSTLATAPDQEEFFVPNASQWVTKTVDLSAYDGIGSISLEFVNIGGYGQAMYLDNMILEYSETLNIAQERNEKNLSIYPNPTSDNITLKTKYEVDKIVLYDMLGIKVLEKTDNTKQINMRHLTTGIYLLYVYMADNSFLIKRIIRQ